MLKRWVLGAMMALMCAPGVEVVASAAPSHGVGHAQARRKHHRKRHHKRRRHHAKRKRHHRAHRRHHRSPAR